MEARTALITLSLAALLGAISAEYTTTFTLHNLCPYTVWPLVTPNAGLPAITGPTDIRLDCNGLTTLTFPAGSWSGRVVPRTGCIEDTTSGCGCATKCETGDAPPATAAQVSVNGPPDGLAEYSVSLVDGFNVPMTITPHQFVAGQQCPALGCAVDLNAACPGDAKVGSGGCRAVGACAQLFKERCPDTRTTPTDVETTPQNCHEPGELKVVFCPTS